jgi:hypothetical protein
MTRRVHHFLAPILLALPALAQTTPKFARTLVIADSQSTQQFVRTLHGTSAVGSLGNATLALNLTQNDLSQDYSTGVGPVTETLPLMFHSLDRIQDYRKGAASAASDSKG